MDNEGDEFCSEDGMSREKNVVSPSSSSLSDSGHEIGSESNESVDSNVPIKSIGRVTAIRVPAQQVSMTDDSEPSDSDEGSIEANSHSRRKDPDYAIYRRIARMHVKRVRHKKLTLAIQVGV